MTRAIQQFFNKSFTLVSRRSFLFSLTSIVLFGLPRKAEALVDQFEPFSFAVVSDTHLATGMPDSYKLLQESQLFLQDCIKTLNALKPNFVMFLGDQVETPGKEDANWQLFLDVVQALGCPWYFVLGEQDVSGTSYIDKMRMYGPDWKGKGIEGNKPYWSYDPMSGIHIVGLDTSSPNTQQGEVSNAQLAWLKNDLSENKHKFTILFSHHPILPPSPFDGGPPWDEYIAPDGAQVREIIGTSPYVRLAISGHVHVSKIQKEKDIWYVSCPSLDVYPCAFRIFHVTPEQISVQTYQVNYPQLVKKAEKQLLASNLAYKYSNRKRELFLEIAEGTPLDQNAIITSAAGKGLEPLNLKKRRKEHKKER